MSDDFTVSSICGVTHESSKYDKNNVLKKTIV